MEFLKKAERAGCQNSQKQRNGTTQNRSQTNNQNISKPLKTGTQRPGNSKTETKPTSEKTTQKSTNTLCIGAFLCCFFVIPKTNKQTNKQTNRTGALQIDLILSSLRSAAEASEASSDAFEALEALEAAAPFAEKLANEATAEAGPPLVGVLMVGGLGR